ncbi:MAG: CDP-archaeol synthase [Dehalococcoidia bacterium]|nr:CDP-archaeol synthase [Dehalococcoidia bacterium]
MIKQRVLSALIVLPIIFLAIWFDGPAYSLIIAAIAALGILEFCNMMGLSKRHPLTLFGLVGVLLFVLVAHVEGNYSAPLLTSIAIFSLIWLLFQRSVKDAANNWAWSLSGIIYIGWLLSHFIPLRDLEGGREWVLFVVLATFAADTAAFFIGRAWGRHSLSPRISSGKTWEGAVGGFLGAIAASLILTLLLNLSIPYWQSVVLGALIGIFAPLGDLAESMLKRSTGLKDSGTLIPGHGGILDRLDSILFTVVIVYYYVIWVIM